MADAENKQETVTAATTPASTTASATTLTQDEIITLQDELAQTKLNLEKSRRGEKFNQTKRGELEQQLKDIAGSEDYKSKYETVTQELETVKTAQKNQLIDGVLKDELTKAGAKAISTVLKLVDRSLIKVDNGQVDAKSVETMIAELKKSDSVLFDVPKTPDIKRPGEAAVTSSFKTEMASAKTPFEVNQILTKYGMGSTI